ncbi:MAG: lysylphosphatidylglycerol synthase transmembrane domain-containing protein [Chromatiales bacterium]|jgi:hypothetical protein
MLSARLRWSLSIALLLLFIVLIESYIGWARLLQPWLAVNKELLGLLLTLVLASYAIRAVRLYVYFHADLRGEFPLALKLMLQHNLANNLLPMRSGELTFPMLMSRYFGVSPSRSMPALLWFRMFDLHTMALLALWALGSQWFGPILVGLVTLCWLALPWLLFLFNHWLLERLEGRGQGRLTGLLIKLLQGAPAHRGLLLKTWFWSLINWLVKLLAFAWLLGLFAHVSIAQSLLGVIGGELTSVLPVHGVAGAGTYEAGIVAALLPLGVKAETAVGAAVNLHLFLLGATLLGGLLSLPLGRRRVA